MVPSRSFSRARPAPCPPPSTGRGRASRSTPRCRDCRNRDGRRAGRRACNRLEIGAAEDAELLEHDVLDHAAVALRHQEGVGRLAALSGASARVDDVDDLECRKRRRRCAAPETLLRDVEDAPCDTRCSARAPRRRRRRVWLEFAIRSMVSSSRVVRALLRLIR